MIKAPLDKILFLDIETVPQVYNYDDVDAKSKALFESKTRYQQSAEKSFESLYEDKGGILSEFGKIICISVGMVKENSMNRSIRLKSYYHDDEETLLKQFKMLLDDNQRLQILCGHNAKEFDFPYICRRMLINGIELPRTLDISGKKPWEISHIDTMELWKFGDYKNYTSLDLLTYIFNIPTSKDDIDGSQVARVYYEDKDLERIIIYCEKDVIATIQLFRRYKGQDIINNDFIKSV